MAQNGRTSFTGPDSEGAGPSSSNGAGMFFDAARRRSRLIQRESTFRKTGSPQHNVKEAHGYSDKGVETAAQFLCDQMKNGRVSESMVEAEQRDDANKLTAWQAVGMPGAGTPDAEKISKIHYRMAVRNRALELHALYDMEPNPDAKAVPGQPEWKPWRAGAAPGGTGY
jgi:hypothetical protein